tara:strand:- start:4155 stop:6260 length:2106 start_codon:yes stop_codon:yes gene_type:complete
MITYLDVETTFTIDENKRTDPLPFTPSNKLVSVQYACDDEEPQFHWFHHKDKTFDTKNSFTKVQQTLDNSQLLVGHNIKFDLVWLWESGFTYNGKVYDTMIGEYLLLRSQKWGISLADSCIRRKVSMKKSSIVQDYLSDGKGFDTMPIHIVEEYGLADIISTRELYQAQKVLFTKEGFVNMRPHLKLMNDFLPVLAKIEQNGIHINLDKLQDVKSDYQKEQTELKSVMESITHNVMGDTPINFASPEQLSQLIYSRKVKDKKRWAQEFNIGTNEKGKPLLRPRMGFSHFATKVKILTDRVHKTKAQHCDYCKGRGEYFKLKKDGTRWKKATKCPKCQGKGYLYIPFPKVAGLTMNPRDIWDVSANGFATDKRTLVRLLDVAKYRKNEDAISFLQSTVRLNAVDVYLSSFVGGIERNTKSNHRLHPKFNQCITRTTRLSSSDPNFQNQPRGNTFPVRAVVVSRFDKGKILQADYSQLEFRVAAQLCGDEVMYQDIIDGKDVHTYTASIIFQKSEKDVTKEERTQAKAHTFKPLYGGTTGTPNETAYYQAFVEKYPKLGKWHEMLQTEAISHGIVSVYTGQQFAFPDTRRLASGSASGAPSIKNYPVQGVAGGCIVPLALIELQKLLDTHNVTSKIINTVHDSIVLDIFPGEENLVAKLTHKAMTEVDKQFEDVYNIKWNVPLAVDIEIGNNWLDMETFYLTN